VQDVVADLRPVRDVDKARALPPRTVNKRVCASIEKDVVRDAFEEARRPDPENAIKFAS
jgi:hypothetical protein